MIQAAHRPGVLLLGESGAGKTALTHDVAEAVGDTMRVERIHGSQSVAQIPYGALIPLLGKGNLAVAESSTTLLLALTKLLQGGDGARKSRTPLLLIVDDADELDGASAAFITQLLVTGQARALVTTRSAYQPALDLLSEQHDGVLVRLRIPPLSQSEVHRICRLSLCGNVSKTVSTLLTEFSRGNPRHLHAGLEQLRLGAYLVQSGNFWIFSTPWKRGGQQETDFITHKLAALPRDAREILEIVALAEPVPLKTLKTMGALREVNLLTERGLLHVAGAGRMQVRPADPLQASAIRRQIPAERRLHLYGRFHVNYPASSEDPESTVRYAMWSLHCGEPPTSPALVASARIAIGAAVTGATQLSEAVTDPEQVAAAEVEIAFAHYFQRRTLDALARIQAIEPRIQDAETLKRLVVLVDLLRAQLGERNLKNVPDTEQVEGLLATLPAQGRHRQDMDSCRRMIQLLSVERLNADEVDVAAQVTGLLRAAEHASDTETSLVALSILGGHLINRGQSDRAVEKSSQALELLNRGDVRLGIHMERVLRTHFLALLQAGRASDVEEVMSGVAKRSWRQIFRHAAIADVAHGLVSFQSGDWKASLEQLGAALEAMGPRGHGDSRPVVLGLAALISALTGEHGMAQQYSRMLDEAEAALTPGAQLMADGLALAALQVMGGDADATRRLRGLADQARRWELPAVELELRMLGLHCRDASSCARTITVAQGMEGQRARLAERAARAVDGHDIGDLLRITASAKEAGFTLLALTCIEWANELSKQLGETEHLPDIRRLLSAIKPRKGARGISRGTHGLTKREREILALVINGSSNAEVAQSLYLSVRTVEGHVYRAYDKLGINSRGQLGRRHLE